MIKYEKLEGEMPNAVKMITDDHSAEMANLQDGLEEAELTDFKVYENIRACKADDVGKFEFVIPGDEVGDFSEFVYDIDGGELEGLCEKWNQEALDAPGE